MPSAWLRRAINGFWVAGPSSLGLSAIGRTSNGKRGLANLYDVSADYIVNPHLTVSGDVGYAAGHSVIRAIYPKDASGMLGFLEITTKF